MRRGSGPFLGQALSHGASLSSSGKQASGGPQRWEESAHLKGLAWCLVLGGPFKPLLVATEPQRQVLCPPARDGPTGLQPPLAERSRGQRGAGTPPGPRAQASSKHLFRLFLHPPAPSTPIPTLESSGMSYLTVSGESPSSWPWPWDWAQIPLLPRPGLSPSGADAAGQCTGLTPSLTKGPKGRRKGFGHFPRWAGPGLAVYGWRWWRR